jgi:acyl-CoA thioesterase YciA
LKAKINMSGKKSNKKVFKEANKKLPKELSGRVPTLQVIAMPEHCNPSGDIFGGWLLSQMDLAGADAAIDVVRSRVVTKAVTAMEFHAPVYIGDKVHLYTDPKKVGNSSIAIQVESWAKRRKDGEYVKVTEGLFTFVKIDMNRKPTPIGPSP